MPFIRLCFLLLALAFCLPAPALAVAPNAAFEFATDGDSLIVALSLDFPPDYHAYAHEPGQAGRPTVLGFTVDGEKVPVWYPPGAMQRDYYDAEATVYVYEGQARLFAAVPLAALGKPYAADLSFLLCSRRNCLPVHQAYSGQLPEAAPPLADMAWAAQWNDLKKSPPPALAATARGEPFSGGLFTAQPGTNESLNPKAEERLALSPSLAAPEALQEERPMPSPEGFPYQFSPRYADNSLEISSLGKALLLGILAGLLLNAMPCVLPVLTFKMSGLLMAGGSGDKNNLQRFREHNLYFAAGVLTLFTGLALVLGLADLIWGQLYQSQGVLLVMLLIVFLMGLSMLGVFTLPIVDLKGGSQVKNPRLQAYLTGLLSTFLATPCSGPLLGGVLGWAFTQPLLVLVVVFWAVGLGMALPYLLLCIWPNMVKVLPRPGPWMHIFERIVGFFLLGTALYLLSILPVEKHMQVLSVLLLVAFCAWFWGRYCGLSAPVLRRRLAAALGAVLLLLAFALVLRPVPPMAQWRDFSPEQFSAQLGQKAMLVEFTADWCPNCKFVEATVLTAERLRQWKARYGMELVRVDLTNANAYGVRLLEALGSKSIPLTALFPTGEGASAPLVLRDVYGVGSLESAMENGFGDK